MNSPSAYERELCSFLADSLTEHKRQLLPRVVLNRTRHITVVVEDIHKSHNASACLRTCDCFGVQDVHVIENRNEFDASSGVELGASQWLTLHRYGEKGDNTSACLKALKSRGYQVVMTSPHEPDCDLETYDVSRPTALVFGNEKDGASQIVRDEADHIMRIPMHGFSESFNISVAVALCLHHLVWRMRQADVDWQLSDGERNELILRWVRTACGKRMAGLEERFSQTWTESKQSPKESLWPDWINVPLDDLIERKERRSLLD